MAILIYIPMALWLVCAITLKTIKRDWLYSSLMLLPLPIIIGWFLAVEPVDQIPGALACSASRILPPGLD